MKQGDSILCVLALLVLSLGCVSCSNDILDPAQLGRFQPVPVVNVILDSLGVADEPDPTYAGSESPRPEDLVSYEQDYVFAVGDRIRITIYELQHEGITYVNDFQVSETGRISIPVVGQLRVVGLTEKKFEDEISGDLSPGILLDPLVTVLLLESEQRTFSIYGWGVNRSGRFTIPRHEFRLTDAIATAGDVGQFNVSNMYISREVPIDQDQDMSYVSPAKSDADEYRPGKPELRPIEPIEPAGAAEDEGTVENELEREILDLIRPYAKDHSMNGGAAVVAAAEFVTAEEMDRPVEPEDAEGKDTQGQGQDEGRIEWVFQNGRWKPMRLGSNGQAEEAVSPQSGAGASVAAGTMLPLRDAQDVMPQQRTRTRVIKIPVDKLKGGDPRYDIIIRPGDRISAPGDLIGEFYVMGNVMEAGIVGLTGRPMTLKMAIAAAGGLNVLAWPKKVEVTRRLGQNKAGLFQEETVMVDLDKIAKGLQPDFFIKQHDLINVGTHGVSRWLYELRSAFRAEYGFGFTYGRNFATLDYGRDLFPGNIGSLGDIF